MIDFIDFEISSICNAGCPVCPRRTQGQYEIFPQSYWKLEDVKRTLTEELVKQITGIRFCGNYGDALGNPDIVEIVKWVLKTNKNCQIDIRTNGGLGDISTYEELGKLGAVMVFGIDGYKKNNELYRVNVKWDRVVKNIEAFALNQKHRNQLEIQFLTWDQTIGDLPKIFNLLKEYKGSKLRIVEPFTHGDYTHAYHLSGEYSHSLTFKSTALTKKLSNKTWVFDNSDELLDIIRDNFPESKKVELIEHTQSKRNITKPYVKDLNLKLTKRKSFVQTCYSKNRIDSSNLEKSIHDLYITHDGYLMPCCLLPPMFATALRNSTGNESDQQKEILNSIVDLGIHNFSVKTKTVQQVLDSGILDKFIYNHFKHNTQFNFCQTVCGKCI